MPLEALIFDVDGTLSETEEVHREAFNQAFAEAGLGWIWDQALYRELLRVTGGRERIRHFMTRAAPHDLTRPDADAWIAGLHKRKTAIYTAMVDDGAVTLRPGVAALLDAARADGVRLAIATTTSLPNVESLLAATLGKGWAGVFEVIAAGDQVPRKKPAPDVFDLALRRLDLPPTACLALEDSANGVASATGAGLGTLVTLSGFTSGDRFDGALAVVEDLAVLAGPAKGTEQEGARILAAIRDLVD
ncbi:MAG: HAD-IA family hydrolase [Pseudomonadota bacterium]